MKLHRGEVHGKVHEEALGEDPEEGPEAVQLEARAVLGMPS